MFVGLVLSGCSSTVPLEVSYGKWDSSFGEVSNVGFDSGRDDEVFFFGQMSCFVPCPMDYWTQNNGFELSGNLNGTTWAFFLTDGDGRFAKVKRFDALDSYSRTILDRDPIPGARLEGGTYRRSAVPLGGGLVKLSGDPLVVFDVFSTTCTPVSFEFARKNFAVSCARGIVIEVNLSRGHRYWKLPRDYQIGRVRRAIEVHLQNEKILKRAGIRN